MSRKLNTELLGRIIVIGIILLGTYSCSALALQDTDLSRSLSNTNSLFILGMLIVIGTVVVPNILGSIIRLKDPEYNPTANYPVFLRLFSEFIYFSATICLMCYIALNQSKGLAAIGLRSLTEIHFKSYLFLGVLFHSFFTLLYVAGHRIIRGKKQIDGQALHRLASGYRTFWERLSFLVTLSIGVVAEELVYRGYLVLLLGEKTNAILICALISVTLSMIVHLYQGRSSIIYHVLFAVVATAVTVWTNSIIMAIAMHIYQNVAATIKSWNQIDKQAAQQSVEPTTSVDTL